MRISLLVAGFFVACANAFAQANVEDPPQKPAEEVIVTGEQPGPGLWKVSQHDHVLWILGTLTPVPKKMTWRSRSVEAVLAQSQSVIAVPRFDPEIGFFKGLMLLPSLIGVRKNPDGARLQEVLPADLYARWRALKDKYIGHDEGVEKWRPIFAAQALYSAAIEKSGLSSEGIVWPVVKKIATEHHVPVTTPQLKISVKAPGPAIREFKKSPLDDLQCFARTLERLETDLDAMKARANAWAVGDVDALSRLPYPDQTAACREAVLNSQVVQERGLQDVLSRRQAMWLAAAEAALARNESTLATLPVYDLLQPEGVLAKLKARGYEVEAP